MTARNYSIRNTLAAMIVAALALPGAAFAAEYRIEKQPVALPAFNLETDGGKPFTNADINGSWSLILIGYTFCPDVCPTTLYDLSLLQGAISEQYPDHPVPKVVFLAVDPDRDRELLPDYISSFEGSFIGATGAPDEISNVVSGLRGFVKYENKDADGNYAVHHSATISLLNASGEVIARINPPFDTDNIAELVVNLMNNS
ncbi:MAG: SCO family protein [Stappiaceae bacterium]